MTAPIREGCEPLSVDGGPTGVLVLHGFTGSPFSVRGITEQMANAGMSVEMPLLAGHGTVIEDMLDTRFADWVNSAEAAFESLAARTERVIVVGLSMGGTLTCLLAERHPEIAGIVLVNPLVEPQSPEMIDGIQALIDGNVEVVDGIGSDIARPDTEERSYPGTPTRALLSLFAGVAEVAGDLGRISCPVLLFSSLEDHVVPPSNGDYVVAQVSGPIERVICAKSFHVATLDYDAAMIEAQSVAFVERVATS